MDLVLCGLTFEACMVYLDDIIIFGPDYDTHLNRLRLVSFLGHVVSANGLEVQEEKVSAVKSWPTPTNLHDVRSFVGFCSYNRRFIESFANIAAPLHLLTRKGVRFTWGPEQQNAFEELKVRLISAPVLAMPIDDGVYYLDTDASDIGLGAVL